MNLQLTTNRDFYQESGTTVNACLYTIVIIMLADIEKVLHLGRCHLVDHCKRFSEDLAIDE